MDDALDDERIVWIACDWLRDFTFHAIDDLLDGSDVAFQSPVEEGISEAVQLWNVFSVCLVEQGNEPLRNDFRALREAGAIAQCVTGLERHADLHSKLLS
jgi:hypothetical protein